MSRRPDVPAPTGPWQGGEAINALALLTPPQASRLFHKLVPISWGNLPCNQLAPGFIPILNSVSPSATQASQLRAFVHTGDPNNATLGQTWQPWPRKFIFDADQKAVRLSVQ